MVFVMYLEFAILQYTIVFEFNRMPISLTSKQVAQTIQANAYCNRPCSQVANLSLTLNTQYIT
jgi:hypothetical protein